MKFTTEAKIEGACAFIRTLHETAGCSAEEIKRLLHPKVIDAVVAMCARRAEGGRRCVAAAHCTNQSWLSSSDSAKDVVG